MITSKSMRFVFYFILLIGCFFDARLSFATSVRLISSNSDLQRSDNVACPQALTQDVTDQVLKNLERKELLTGYKPYDQLTAQDMSDIAQAIGIKDLSKDISITRDYPFVSYLNQQGERIFGRMIAISFGKTFLEEDLKEPIKEVIVEDINGHIFSIYGKGLKKFN